MTSAELLDAESVSKTFHVRGGGRKGGRLRAVDDISLRLGRGETLGIVGESGCGKSTLARLLLMLEKPDSGSLRFEGRDVHRSTRRERKHFRSRVQMVFQDPYASLNPRMSVEQVVSEPWSTRGIGAVPRGRAARQKRVAELLELVGLRAADATRYPSEFSGGQRQRIGIARALALNPDVLVCDEPVSALDLSVQAQVLNLMTRLQRELEVSYIFISHDLAVMRHVADRIAVMYLGRVVESGPAEEIFASPRHPYTAALLAAAPDLDAIESGEDRPALIEGEIPSPLNPPSGCRFRTRCPRARERCASEAPTTERTEPWFFECHFPLAPAVNTPRQV